jgi:hypothetical protein
MLNQIQFLLLFSGFEVQLLKLPFKPLVHLLIHSYFDIIAILPKVSLIFQPLFLCPKLLKFLLSHFIKISFGFIGIIRGDSLMLIIDCPNIQALALALIKVIVG